MGGEGHISEGRCPLYGAVPYSPNDRQEDWRHRISNEKVGAPFRDDRGCNAALSLLWYSGPADGRRMVSQVRHSSRKLMQDYGVRMAPTSAAPSSPGPAPTPAAQPAAEAGRPVPARHPSVSGRLTLAAYERELGQNFLQIGNLVLAKMHFDRAQHLLSTPSG